MAMRHIRITEAPPGEAPARIRAAWVNIVLPLADIPQAQPDVWITRGVLGKDRGVWARIKRLFGIPVVEQPEVGYLVDTIIAVELLRAHAPSAAAWWDRHTPHLLVPGRKLVFAASCCEEVGHVVN